MKFVIDCDTGHDDAVAILLAARHLDVIEITTVFGTSSVENTTRNTLQILTLADLYIPVTAGCADPLVSGRPGVSTHGWTGLDGAELPEPAFMPTGHHAVDVLIESARRHRENLTIIATAPLTNLAIAIRKEPRLRSWVSEISIMGGSAGSGNRTAAAEANFASDPEAASIVLSSGIPCRLAGYDLTRTFGLSAADMAELAASGRRTATAVASLQGFYLKRQQERFGLHHAPLHDCCAVLPFIAPSLLQSEMTAARVELSGQFTRGMTVFDRRGSAQPDGIAVNLAVDIDRAATVVAVKQALLAYP